MKDYYYAVYDTLDAQNLRSLEAALAQASTDAYFRAGGRDSGPDCEDLLIARRLVAQIAERLAVAYTAAMGK